jgi:hypothetical protein
MSLKRRLILGVILYYILNISNTQRQLFIAQQLVFTTRATSGEKIV